MGRGLKHHEYPSHYPPQNSHMNLNSKDIDKFPFGNWGKHVNRWQLFVGVQGFISCKRLHCRLLEHYSKHSLTSFHHLSQQLHFYHQATTFNFSVKYYNIKSSNCYSLCLFKEVFKILRFHFTTYEYNITIKVNA